MILRLARLKVRVFARPPPLPPFCPIFAPFCARRLFPEVWFNFFISLVSYPSLFSKFSGKNFKKNSWPGCPGYYGAPGW